MARVSTETLTVGILALLLALIGAYLAKQWMQKDVELPPPRRTRVPLAASDLPAGRRVAIGDVILVPMSDDQLRDRQWPLDFLMLDARAIVGRTLKFQQEQGEPFLVNRLYPVGQSPDLADKLKPGFRAVSFTTTPDGGVSGNVRQGAMVDVIFFPDLKKSSIQRKGLKARPYTILESKEVLAIQGSRSGARGESYVTLAVTPEEAMLVRTIEKGGQLSLALRNPGEEVLVGTASRGKTFEEAMGLDTSEEQEIPFVEFATQIVRRGNSQINRYRYPRPGSNNVEDELPSLRADGSSAEDDLPQSMRGRKPQRTSPSREMEVNAKKQMAELREIFDDIQFADERTPTNIYIHNEYQAGPREAQRPEGPRKALRMEDFGPPRIDNVGPARNGDPTDTGENYDSLEQFRGSEE